MSSIHSLPDVATLKREAYAWIGRLHADDVTVDDLRRFEEWRATSARHARIFEAVVGTVLEIKRAKGIVHAVSLGNTVNAASHSGTAPPSARDSAVAKRPARILSGMGWAAAATLAGVGIAAIWWLTQYGAPQNQFQTAIGEHASVELNDGSRLDLNTNSAARVEYTEGSRTIRLIRGEAFFTVAPDARRPFWVVAGSSWIRALGTEFNVDLRSSEVRVVVSEGSVKVASTRPGEHTPSDASLARESVSVLKAGQQAEMRPGLARILPVAPLELTRLAAWRTGKLYFENQPLETVVNELARYTREQILIEDPALKRLSIDGTFQANSKGVEALLGMLSQGFELRVRHESDRIYIEGKSGEP